MGEFGFVLMATTSVDLLMAVLSVVDCDGKLVPAQVGIWRRLGVNIHQPIVSEVDVVEGERWIAFGLDLVKSSRTI